MDMATPGLATLQQHLIDPVICIRCNTCESVCPVGAITHDSRNYVVDAGKCNLCMACVPPCPTGSIDNWRQRPQSSAYSVEEQLTWDELPAPLSDEQLAALGVVADEAVPPGAAATQPPSTEGLQPFNSAQYGSSTPPWSAAHPYTNLYGPKAPTTATVVGNHRVTDAGFENDTHHLVLDFGAMPFPVLEGQSIGIIPPGEDGQGKPHFARQYSIASPRNGERPGYNNLSLTVKRVTHDHQGQPVRGVASNYVCDLKVGDTVQVIGPFGHSFLMPNHPRSNIVMVCTGTGSAPMRAMTEWRRRLRQSAAGASKSGLRSAAGGHGAAPFEGAKLMLFFGSRTPQELPYFGPLQSLPKDFIDIHLAFSRQADTPKRYVQDLMRERAVDLADLLKDPHTYVYVCGLKAMEEGVVLALRDVAQQAGMHWDTLGAQMKKEGRLHLETY